MLGNTLLADVYNSANRMPNVVYELFLGGIFTASLMPVFIGAERDDDVEATTSVISTDIIALLVVTMIALLGSPMGVSRTLCKRSMAVGRPGG